MDKSKHAFWQEILSEYSHSNQTVVDFCSDFGIPVWKFYYWRKRLSATKPVFEELSVKPSPTSGSGIELSIGSLRISVASDFDESTLRRVLSVLSC
jgi:hypothetical protein